MQYHTGIDGRFSTFNYGAEGTTQDSHLRNQNYKVCIRQEEGYCCIIYMKCDANSFQLNPGGTADNTKAHQGSDCTGDYITIEGSSQSGFGNLNDKYCGGILNTIDENLVDAKIRDCTAPFEVGVVTDNIVDASAASIANGITGVCLTWTQEPCSAGNQGP